MIKLDSNSYNVVAAFFFFLAGVFGILGRNYITAFLLLLLSIIFLINFISKRKKIR
ncbi:hypothetical protein [Clostridium thermobutyricum]|uniref:hypothetical protein n=1 Tax=Clostridium thermobutyricum TaxID=29372 RepID=UPI0029424364|nr:hypothetical protein [Clostridium thermobutyricum]